MIDGHGGGCVATYASGVLLPHIAASISRAMGCAIVSRGVCLVNGQLRDANALDLDGLIKSTGPDRSQSNPEQRRESAAKCRKRQKQQKRERELARIRVRRYRGKRKKNIDSIDISNKNTPIASRDTNDPNTPHKRHTGQKGIPSGAYVSAGINGNHNGIDGADAGNVDSNGNDIGSSSAPAANDNDGYNISITENGNPSVNTKTNTDDDLLETNKDIDRENIPSDTLDYIPTDTQANLATTTTSAAIGIPTRRLCPTKQPTGYATKKSTKSLTRLPQRRSKRRCVIGPLVQHGSKLRERAPSQIDTPSVTYKHARLMEGKCRMELNKKIRDDGDGFLGKFVDSICKDLLNQFDHHPPSKGGTGASKRWDHLYPSAIKIFFPKPVPEGIPTTTLGTSAVSPSWE